MNFQQSMSSAMSCEQSSWLSPGCDAAFLPRVNCSMSNEPSSFCIASSPIRNYAGSSCGTSKVRLSQPELAHRIDSMRGRSSRPRVSLRLSDFE